MAEALDVFIIAGPNGAGKTTFARVRQRVLQGGHDIPSDVIARRFDSGFRNFENLYKQAVDAWAVYDNSGLEPVLRDWNEK